jgi:hypothetical protein
MIPFSHDRYDDDAEVDFPRFAGVTKIRERRSRDPGSVMYDIRRVRVADGIWVAEMTVSQHGDEPRYGLTCSRSGTARSCTRRWSTSANRSTR